MVNSRICTGESREGTALREYWAKAYGDDRISTEVYDRWLDWIESEEEKWKSHKCKQSYHCSPENGQEDTE